MKRLVSYVVLGFAVVGLLFVGGFRTEIQLTQQAKLNMARLGHEIQEVKGYVRSWLGEDKEETVVVSTDNSPQRASLDVNYDAALEIVEEMLKDLEHLFTADQQQAVQKEMDQLYKQHLLRQYKDQLAPSYYE